MKKLCLILAYLFLFTQTISAMPLLVGQKVVYRGTVTDLRISAVDGTAFIDNAGATIPTYADGNHQIEIYDSSNRMLRGVLKAAGTSEGLGSELASSWASTGYETFNATGTTINEAADDTSANGRSATNALGLSAGSLLKVSFNFTLNSGVYPSISWFSSNIGYQAAYSVQLTTDGSQASYGTQPSTNSHVGFANNRGATNFAVASYSAKQVTAPSSSGCSIVSAKGGEVYNFSYKNASFTYNEASYYVIIRAIR